MKIVNTKTIIASIILVLIVGIVACWKIIGLTPISKDHLVFFMKKVSPQESPNNNSDSEESKQKVESPLLLVTTGQLLISDNHDTPNSEGVMVTVNPTLVFPSPSEVSTPLLSIPTGQMLQNDSEAEDWINVQLFNGGPKGYVKRANLKWCPSKDLGFEMPPQIVSIIEPLSDTVGLLFVDEHYDDPKWLDVDDINFEQEVKRFGMSGYTPDLDKVVLLSNGLYATINREYNNSSVVFFNIQKKTVEGVVTPTPSNWAITICNDKLYAGHVDSITVIDYKKMRAIGEINVSGLGLLCWKNKKLYAVASGSNRVAIINPVTDTTIKFLSVGPAPWEIWQCRGNKICVKHAGYFYID